MFDTDGSSSMPPQVEELLRKTDIGYLSVSSPKGVLYSYPIAFYFTGWAVYFVTPVSSAKMKFIKTNRKVSLIVDNRKLTKDAVGTLLQGDAHILTAGRLLTSIFSALTTVRGFTKKYPGMLSFYAKGKELPDERKLHKYRLIRITPTSIVYWIGYKYGRCVPKKRKSNVSEYLKTDQKNAELTPEAAAGLLESGSEVPEFEHPLLMDESWLSRLDEATSKGGVSSDERRIIRSFANASSASDLKLANVKTAPKVTIEEKSMLKKWRASSGTQM